MYLKLQRYKSEVFVYGSPTGELYSYDCIAYAAKRKNKKTGKREMFLTLRKMPMNVKDIQQIIKRLNKELEDE